MDLLTKIGRTLTQEDYKKLFEEGLFVFDTNVLLDLYRLPNEAKEDLLLILESKELKNRVWLPFQAQLEYIYNKNGVIREQNTKFGEVNSKLSEFESKIHNLYKEIEDDVNKLNLKRRHSSIKIEDYVNEDLFKPSLDTLDSFKKKLEELKEKQPDISDADKIGDRIIKIFKGKVGNSFDKEELKKIFDEGKDRYKIKFPPGYKDDKKEGSHFYEDKEYIRKYGDLILWKEIIQKAEKDKTEYIVLVSSDLKDDWRDTHKSVRHELLNEIYHAAKKLKIFHIYDSSNFMKYAKEHLNLEVSDESIKEARDIQTDKRVVGAVKITTIINNIAKRFDIEVNYGASEQHHFMSNEKIKSFSFLVSNLFEYCKNTIDIENNCFISIFETLEEGGPRDEIAVFFNFTHHIKDINSNDNFYEYALAYHKNALPYIGSINVEKHPHNNDLEYIIVDLFITP